MFQLLGIVELFGKHFRYVLLNLVNAAFVEVDAAFVEVDAVVDDREFRIQSRGVNLESDQRARHVLSTAKSLDERRALSVNRSGEIWKHKQQEVKLTARAAPPFPPTGPSWTVRFASAAAAARGGALGFLGRDSLDAEKILVGSRVGRDRRRWGGGVGRDDGPMERPIWGDGVDVRLVWGLLLVFVGTLRGRPVVG